MRHAFSRKIAYRVAVSTDSATTVEPWFFIRTARAWPSVWATFTPCSGVRISTVVWSKRGSPSWKMEPSWLTGRSACRREPKAVAWGGWLWMTQFTSGRAL